MLVVKKNKKKMTTTTQHNAVVTTTTAYAANALACCLHWASGVFRNIYSFFARSFSCASCSYVES